MVAWGCHDSDDFPEAMISHDSGCEFQLLLQRSVALPCAKFARRMPNSDRLILHLIPSWERDGICLCSIVLTAPAHITFHRSTQVFWSNDEAHPANGKAAFGCPSNAVHYRGLLTFHGLTEFCLARAEMSSSLVRDFQARRTDKRTKRYTHH
jgi:hypothetical protein